MTLPAAAVAGLLLLCLAVLLTASWSGGAADDASPQSPDHTTPATARGRSMADQELSKGMFLVADRKLRDPRFAEAVILPCRLQQPRRDGPYHQPSHGDEALRGVP
ncbi:MAG: hypothetical protein MZV70_28555 [Desulfobacterales bacterium]|nr:hypothetical protein [Desulfobacterales bacterium]